MGTLLENYSEYCKKQEKNLPFSFNVLDEQCGHIVENSHTNVLMRILQYKNQYGYVFLEKFFDYMGLGIKIAQNQDIKFDREKFYKDGRIDGVIYQENQFALIIENKVNKAGNQKSQLKRYINAVLDDKNAWSPQLAEEKIQRVWVCFLTKDGREKPDTVSQDYMSQSQIGICTQICDNNGNGVVEGPRYAAINYLDHILPWLKEEIQPIVLQRDHTLNAGILQYIDFLEGMFGLRQADTELLHRSKEWLNHNYSDLYKGPFNKTKNSKLDKISKQIAKELKESLEHTKKSDNSDLRRYAGLLNKLITDINDDPMKAFFDYTRQYFESKGLMKQCVISHIFNYDYIQIRDDSWPRCIHFEWYPLGINKLMSKSPDLQLCLHVENTKYYDAFKNFTREHFKHDSQRTSTLSYSYTIKYNQQKSIMSLNGEELKDFLYNAYGFINENTINSIETAIASVNNKVQIV